MTEMETKTPKTMAEAETVIVGYNIHKSKPYMEQQYVYGEIHHNYPSVKGGWLKRIGTCTAEAIQDMESRMPRERMAARVHHITGVDLKGKMMLKQTLITPLMVDGHTRMVMDQMKAAQKRTPASTLYEKLARRVNFAKLEEAGQISKELHEDYKWTKEHLEGRDRYHDLGEIDKAKRRVAKWTSDMSATEIINQCYQYGTGLFSEKELRKGLLKKEWNRLQVQQTMDAVEEE